MAERSRRAAMLAASWLLLMSAWPNAANGEILLTSGPERVALVELFTSEGCSSCPPADRWLSRLTDEAGLWRDFVPVAFHVDYWDYIGWRDRFAAPSHGNRQRAYADGGSVPAVYTPGFVLDGREWRAWQVADMPPVSTARPGVLNASVAADTVTVDYSPASEEEGLFAHVALLGFDLVTSVEAGENRNRTLVHDFVVVALEQGRMSESGGVHRASVRLPANEPADGRRAIAVWVSRSDSPSPLQAAGRWLSADGAGPALER